MSTTTSDIAAGELLPCPFCGGPARPFLDRKWYRIQCRNCGAQGAASNRPEKTEEMWERRAYPWQPIETAPKDGTHFLATITVCHMNRRRWRETHLIWANDSTGTVDNECHQGWEIDDYEAWMPVPEYGPPTAPSQIEEG